MPQKEKLKPDDYDIYTTKTPPFIGSHLIQNVQNTCAVATQHEIQEQMRKSDRTFAQSSQLQCSYSRRSFTFYVFPVWTTEGRCETQQTSPGKDGISNSRLTLMDDSELKGKIKNNKTVWEVEVSVSTEQTNHRCWSEGSHQIALTTSRVFMRNLWFNSRMWTSLLGLVVHKCVHNTHNNKFWSLFFLIKI